MRFHFQMNDTSPPKVICFGHVRFSYCKLITMRKSRVKICLTFNISVCVCNCPRKYTHNSINYFVLSVYSVFNLSACIIHILYLNCMPMSHTVKSKYTMVYYVILLCSVILCYIVLYMYYTITMLYYTIS